MFMARCVISRATVAFNGGDITIDGPSLCEVKERERENRERSNDPRRRRRCCYARQRAYTLYMCIIKGAALQQVR